MTKFHESGILLGEHSIPKCLKSEILQKLAKRPEVEKIIIGRSAGCRHRRPVGTIELKRTLINGEHWRGYTSKGVTEIYVVIKNQAPNGA